MGQMPSNRLCAFMPMSDLEDRRDFSFTDIRGFQVLNTTGHKVGTVKEIYVDANTLEPHFAFLDYSKGFKLWNNDGKHFLVPWGELIIGEDFVQTRWTEQELRPETLAEQEKNLAEHGGPGHQASPPTITCSNRGEGKDTGADSESGGVLTPAGISGTTAVE